MLTNQHLPSKENDRDYPALHRRGLPARPDGIEFVEGAQFRGHEGLVDRVSEAYGLFVASWAARVFLVLDDGRIVQDYHLTVQPLPEA